MQPALLGKITRAALRRGVMPSTESQGLIVTVSVLGQWSGRPQNGMSAYRKGSGILHQ